jgi:uncharacterized membrane protein (DUF485 family)
MRRSFSVIAILSSAAFLGNMLVIGLGYGMYWQSLESLEFMTQFGRQFPYLLLPTMVLLFPAILANLFLFLRSELQSEVRKSWLFAFVFLMIACVITGVYHLPTNFDFMEMAYSEKEAQSQLEMWLILHWVRTGFVLVASIFSLRAFQKSIH